MNLCTALKVQLILLVWASAHPDIIALLGPKSHAQLAHIAHEMVIGILFRVRQAPSVVK